MGQVRATLLNFLLRNLYKRRLKACRTPFDWRKVGESAPALVPRGARFAAATMGGVAGEWVEGEDGATRGALIYLHGGGYVCMSPKSHRAITAAFALRGLRVFVPDYRLAPEHPFPAALDDALAVWRALRSTVEGPIFVAGDSAGGGLALALMLALRDHGEPGPGAACLFSPWTDLAGAGFSLQANRDRDPLLAVENFDMMARAYAGEADVRNPLLSPVYADFAGLPRMIAFVGDTEMLLDDSTRVAARAKEAAVPFDLRVYRGMPHVWPFFNVILPEGRKALDEAAAFLS